MTQTKTKTKHYFSFGCGQPLQDYYVVIEADTPEGARELMLEQFGRCWSFQYTEEFWTSAYDVQYWNGVSRHRKFYEVLKQIGPLEATHHHEWRATARQNESSRH